MTVIPSHDEMSENQVPGVADKDPQISIVLDDPIPELAVPEMIVAADPTRPV